MKDFEIAIAAADAGAAVVRSRFRTPMGRIDKGSNDFATDADVESERAIIAVIQRERPEDAIVGEETGQSGPTKAARRWLIDPLCGTQNYAVGTSIVAVNVALRSGYDTLAAAVAEPFSDEVLWTDGVVARARAGDRDTDLIPDGASRIIDLSIDTPWPNAPALRTTALGGDPAFTKRFEPRVLSTTLALAWVASGRRAAYMTDGDVRSSVHFAAGLAVCQAARCVVTDLRGRPWHESGKGIIAAADGETHETLVNMVRRFLQE